MSSLADSLLDPGLRFKFLFLRFMLTKALTATMNTTRRTTATGANNTGQRLAEETGLMLVGMAEAEGTTLLVEAEETAFCETLFEAVEGTGVTPIYGSKTYPTWYTPLHQFIFG